MKDYIKMNFIILCRYTNLKDVLVKYVLLKIILLYISQI